MTSYLVENVHLELLNKLLSDSGLECFRSPQESSEVSSSSRSVEEQSPAEEEEVPPTVVVEEEAAKIIVEETVSETLPQIFPTPSLRLVMSDRARAIEKQNRIHVLPEEFKTNIDPQAIPKILSTPQQKYIEILADLVGCTRYKSSLAEFWFLDTLANLLRRAQEDELDRPTQAILMLWFCEWMKEMQHFDAADRKRMIRRFQDNMLAATKYIVEMDQLPTPAQAGVYYKALNPNEFSTDYQYNLVRSVFCFTPEYSLLDAPYQLQNPKKLYTPLKVKVKKVEKSPKKDKDAGKLKGKKKEIDPPEFLAFLEKKATADRSFEDKVEYEMEQWNLKSHILPLTLAATDELFDKYWPPPAPPPVVEVLPETPKPKVKKGKK